LIPHPEDQGTYGRVELTRLSLGPVTHELAHRARNLFGLKLTWQADYRLRVVVGEGDVLISANAAGLRSLAQHLLTLAQDHVPPGVHAHMEPALELEDDSAPLIIEKN
jgi:hypothetical protein